MEVITVGDNATSSVAVDKVIIHEEYKKAETPDKPNLNDIALIRMRDKMNDIEVLTMATFDKATEYHAYTKGGVVSVISKLNSQWFKFYPKILKYIFFFQFNIGN